MFRKSLCDKGMTFSEKLLALAHAHRIRYEELGAIVGASKGSVDRWVNRGVSPRLDQVVTYARHFNVPVAYLADDAQDTLEPAASDLSPAEQAILDVVRTIGDPGEVLRRLFVATPAPVPANGGRQPMIRPGVTEVTAATPASTARPGTPAAHQPPTAPPPSRRGGATGSRSTG